ncbi:hypothetical protein E7V67_011335 [[Empedobacter] haloabium]|uniref:Uncharacterized protein n=1 Tax=[Empedobacter] haloabium TaxID=592317 RepID=A0ABZ1USE3_9BURK
MDVQFSLPWHVTCALACRALAQGRTFDQIVVDAIEKGVIYAGG